MIPLQEEAYQVAMFLLWAKVFAITIALETPLYVLGLSKVMSPVRAVLASILVNLATHPVVWFVLPGVFPEQVHYALAAEAMAITVEAGLLFGACLLFRGNKKSLLWFLGLCFLVNAASTTLGQVVFLFLDVGAG